MKSLEAEFSSPFKTILIRQILTVRTNMILHRLVRMGDGHIYECVVTRKVVGSEEDLDRSTGSSESVGLDEDAVMR